MKNKRNLPRHIYVTDDLPREVRDARKQLQAEASEYHARGYRVSIAYPARLIVNGSEVRHVVPKYIPQLPRVVPTKQQPSGVAPAQNKPSFSGSKQGAPPQMSNTGDHIAPRGQRMGNFPPMSKQNQEQYTLMDISYSAVAQASNVHGKQQAIDVSNRMSNGSGSLVPHVLPQHNIDVGIESRSNGCPQGATVTPSASMGVGPGSGYNDVSQGFSMTPKHSMEAGPAMINSGDLLGPPLIPEQQAGVGVEMFASGGVQRAPFEYVRYS